MRTHSALSWAFAVLTVLLLVPALVHRPASAAQLHVTAAPIQTWRITDGLPDLPDLGVDLSACGDLDDYDEIVTGTDGDDALGAGNGEQILVGLGGDDTISGGNHDDCLLGGAGDDLLEGGNGKDVLVGGRGADELDGGHGPDLLDAGGDPGDVCTSEGAPDELIGCEAPEATASDVPVGTDVAGAAGSDDQPGKPSGESDGPKNGPAASESKGGEQPEVPPAPVDEGPAQDPPVDDQPFAPADEAQVTTP